MPKFSVNYDQVVDMTSKKSYKLSDVNDKIEKIAFDVVRFKDGPQDELWQIQSTDDGDYIIAIYSDEEKISTASVQDWSVVIKNSDLHFFYKKDHICKVASKTLGFNDQDLVLAKRYLPSKLSENKNLVNSLLKSVDSNSLKNILAKYPELV